MNDFEKTRISSIRKSTWLPLDEVLEIALSTNTNITRSGVYRTFVHEKINKVPQKEKDKVKKFKELSEACPNNSGGRSQEYLIKNFNKLRVI